MIPISRTLSLVQRGLLNYIFRKPLCASFEVTYNCNARCRHCHLGHTVAHECASPETYGEISRTLRPFMAQISGGEPLLRNDVERVIQQIRRPGRSPFMVITTNGSLLDQERYASLRAAGLDEVSLSLDYPDERHDEFRNIPGLFGHIADFVRGIRNDADRAVTLACVVQKYNFRDLLKIAALAQQWGVKVSFSTYTWLRTQVRGLLVPKQDLAELKAIIARLIEHKKAFGVVRTSEYYFRRMLSFFENSGIPNCRAGEKFVVVNPDGSMSPCGLLVRAYRSQAEMVDKFLRQNRCRYCYTASRGNSEKPAWYLLRDLIGAV